MRALVQILTLVLMGSVITLWLWHECAHVNGWLGLLMLLLRALVIGLPG